MARLIDKMRELLQKGGAPDSLEGCSERDVIRTLMMLIHDGEDIVRQRACWELARIVCRMKPAKIENLIRRLLWRLNPESGDHPIGAPELLGEIGNRAPKRIKSFVSVILYYLDDEKLLPGLLQAAGRIGEKLPDVLAEHIGNISQCLAHENEVISGNAALALHRIGGSRAEEALRVIEKDTREVTIVCGDESRKVKLGELATHGFKCAHEMCFIADRR